MSCFGKSCVICPSGPKSAGFIVGPRGPQGPQGPEGPQGTLECFTSTCDIVCDDRQVNVLEPLPLDVPDVDIVIHTRGTGALMVDVPDGTIEGGDCRGIYAVDLQSDRTASSQVASGDYSVVGGGRSNVATGLSSTIAGGFNNRSLGDASAVLAGENNEASDTFSTVGGGNLNRAGGVSSTVGGGVGNQATGLSSTVGGGFTNQATVSGSSVGGGVSNRATGVNSRVGGGDNNQATGQSSTIGGGSGNQATGRESTVGGGFQNQATGRESTVGGGFQNQATGRSSTVGGGSLNQATALDSTIGGGFENRATQSSATVGGGSRNQATALNSTVGGGRNNQSTGVDSVIGGGNNNRSTAFESTVGGGRDNQATGQSSTVAGGFNNVATAQYSAALGGEGLRLTAAHSSAVGKFNEPGAFVYSDEIPPSERIFMVGYGNGDLDRFNLFSVTADGNAHIRGTLYTTGGADFAEFFESASGERIALGTPVVFSEQTGKIRPAKEGELPFGVISNTASYIGNAGEEEWVHKYERHQDGSLVWETYERTEDVPVFVEKEVTSKREVIDYTQSPPRITYVDEKQIVKVQETVEAVALNEKGEEEKREVPKVQKVTRQLIRKKVSPLYDHTKEYVPRVSRKEWNVVGLLGVVKVIKGAPVNDRWVRIKDHGEYDLYLIK